MSFGLVAVRCQQHVVDMYDDPDEMSRRVTQAAEGSQFERFPRVSVESVTQFFPPSTERSFSAKSSTECMMSLVRWRKLSRVFSPSALCL